MRQGSLGLTCVCSKAPAFGYRRALTEQSGPPRATTSQQTAWPTTPTLRVLPTRQAPRQIATQGVMHITLTVTETVQGRSRMLFRLDPKRQQFQLVVADTYQPVDVCVGARVWVRVFGGGGGGGGDGLHLLVCVVCS